MPAFGPKTLPKSGFDFLPLVTRWQPHSKGHRKVKFFKNAVTQKPLVLEASFWS